MKQLCPHSIPWHQKELKRLEVYLGSDTWRRGIGGRDRASTFHLERVPLTHCLTLTKLPLKVPGRSRHPHPVLSFPSPAPPRHQVSERELNSTPRGFTQPLQQRFTFFMVLSSCQNSYRLPSFDSHCNIGRQVAGKLAPLISRKRK